MINSLSSDTEAADIFALGCIFYYALSNGAHPFKSTTHYFEAKIVENIKAGKCHIQSNLRCDEEYKKACVKDLVEQMTNKNPLKRPCCEFILNYIVFWKKIKIFRFLKICHLDESEMKCFNVKSYESVIGKEWTKRVKSPVVENLKGRDKNSIRTLILVMAKTVRKSVLNFEFFSNYFLDQIHSTWIGGLF